MSNSNETPRSGIGFFGLLTILFIGLKLAGYIDWSWVWVLAPLWVRAILLFLAVVVVGCNEVINGKR